MFAISQQQKKKKKKKEKRNHIVHWVSQQELIKTNILRKILQKQLSWGVL